MTAAPAALTTPAGRRGAPRVAGARRGRLRLLPVVLGALAFAATASTLGDPGLTWDEPAYFDSARLHLEWLRQVPARASEGSLATWTSRDTLEAYWHSNPYANPHPPLYKVLGGLGWAAFHPRLGDLAAFRLSSALLFGLLVAGLGAWTARASGSPVAGAAASLSLALMPRVVGDAHVAATDLPLTAFWALAAAAFWAAVRGGRPRHALLFGLLWGCALATKFNGLLLPVPLALWAVIHSPRALPRVLLLGGAVAAAAMVLLNPWLWPDPVGRLLAFVAQSTSRQEWAPIWTWYGGRVHEFVLPWHHAPVLTLVTVPLPLLLLGAVGAARLRERRQRPLVSMALVQVAFYQLVMALPSSPGHDGVRLFLPQFPFLALLAGLGFGDLQARLARRVRAKSARRPALAARAALAFAFFAPPALALARVHPHELAYYNEVVGGASGARARGFESTYWFDAATPAFLRRVERELPPGARVWAHPAPWHWLQVQRAGLVRRDLVFTDRLPAPYLLLMTRQGLFGPFERRLHENVEPVVAETYEGVPLMALYRWE